jgi:hypothetical protein
MNNRSAFLDGMLSVFSLDGLYGVKRKRFVPENSSNFNAVREKIKNYVQKINTTTFEERVLEDIRSDFDATAQDMWSAIGKIADETNAK